MYKPEFEEGTTQEIVKDNLPKPQLENLEYYCNIIEAKTGYSRVEIRDIINNVVSEMRCASIRMALVDFFGIGELVTNDKFAFRSSAKIKQFFITKSSGFHNNIQAVRGRKRKSKNCNADTDVKTS